jgi:hypothetical protein
MEAARGWWNVIEHVKEYIGRSKNITIVLYKMHRGSYTAMAATTSWLLPSACMGSLLLPQQPTHTPQSTSIQVLLFIGISPGLKGTSFTKNDRVPVAPR